MFSCISFSTNTNGIPRHLISRMKVFCRDKDVRRSPLRHLLKCNATPSDSEVIAIRALITDAEACIEELHRCFPAPDHASQVIESQLLKIIEAHRALLSPVRHLPSEILQEIFRRYADNSCSIVTIATMPWRLGHISHRWRKIALSFPYLWDNIPRITLFAKPRRLYVRALMCLIQRSGTSPTLKFRITNFYPDPSRRKIARSIIKVIMLHSERIEQLHIYVSKSTVQLLQGFKGRLPNLRILRVYLLDSEEVPNLDVFETAPALRHVAIEGAYQHNHSVTPILLPWSQITHFMERLPGGIFGQFVPLSSLHSLTCLHFDKHAFDGEYTPLSPYPPTTLPNLRTLIIIFHNSYYKEVDVFLESLTIPAVEVMKIRCTEPLIPRLVSMFSGSRGPYRLQKLALFAIPLQTGELSALLNLTPHLVELDIDLPPVDDLLRLIYGEGGVMLVPMLQALYIQMQSFGLTGTQTEHFNTLAQVRCELGSREDSEDATMPSLGPWTALHTLRFVFPSAGNRDRSQEILNNLSSSFTPEEAEAMETIRLCSCRISSKFQAPVLENRDEHLLDQLLACLEHCEVTNKLLHETRLRINLPGVLTRLQDQDTYNLKQRIIDILAEWNQLLLNDFSGYRWARISPELNDFSLVYVSKSKIDALRLSPDGGLSILYGLNLSFEQSLLRSSRSSYGCCESMSSRASLES